MRTQGGTDPLRLARLRTKCAHDLGSSPSDLQTSAAPRKTQQPTLKMLNNNVTTLLIAGFIMTHRMNPERGSRDLLRCNDNPRVAFKKH